MVIGGNPQRTNTTVHYRNHSMQIVSQYRYLGGMTNATAVKKSKYEKRWHEMDIWQKKVKRTEALEMWIGDASQTDLQNKQQDPECISEYKSLNCSI